MAMRMTVRFSRQRFETITISEQYETTIEVPEGREPSFGMVDANKVEWVVVSSKIGTPQVSEVSVVESRKAN